MDLVNWFDSQPLWLRILLIVITGGIISGIYRILRFTQSNDTATLVAGIFCFIFFGFIIMIVDVITLATDNKITVLCK